MKIASFISCLESIAPPVYQESYDNVGLITGNSDWDCTGILVTLDATEAIVDEAIQQKANLIVAHHPIIFSGLKKINGKNYVERAVIKAIRNDVAIYAIHTNLDNTINGVNGRMADKLGLINRQALLPKSATLKKLFTFVPEAHAEKVRTALFEAGAGIIGNYNEASFNVAGTGTFKALAGANPFVGKQGLRHEEKEIRIEVVFPGHLQNTLVAVLRQSHPYEEVAYDIVDLANFQTSLGSGLIGDLPDPIEEKAFLAKIKAVFGLSVIRHTRLIGQPVKTVAICGGAGSFLISKALSSGAGFYISSDIKYHEFFDADDKMVVADIGHFESEQFTIDLLYDILRGKFPTFAVLKPAISTNPVHYYL
jgi:dinuclear metal center YbgI/SA1388 family protein